MCFIAGPFDPSLPRGPGNQFLPSGERGQLIGRALSTPRPGQAFTKSISSNEAFQRLATVFGAGPVLESARSFQAGKGPIVAEPLSSRRSVPPSSPSSTRPAPRGKKRKAGFASGRRGTFQTSGGGLGLLTPASSAKKTLLGV